MGEREKARENQPAYNIPSGTENRVLKWEKDDLQQEHNIKTRQSQLGAKRNKGKASKIAAKQLGEIYRLSW